MISQKKIVFIAKEGTFFAIPVCVPGVGGERPDDHLWRPVHVGVAGEGVDLRDGHLVVVAAVAAGCCCVAAAVFGSLGGEEVDLGDEGNGHVGHAAPVVVGRENVFVFFF